MLYLRLPPGSAAILALLDPEAFVAGSWQMLLPVSLKYAEFGPRALKGRPRKSPHYTLGHGWKQHLSVLVILTTIVRGNERLLL